MRGARQHARLVQLGLSAALAEGGADGGRNARYCCQAAKGVDEGEARDNYGRRRGEEAKRNGWLEEELRGGRGRGADDGLASLHLRAKSVLMQRTTAAQGLKK